MNDDRISRQAVLDYIDNMPSELTADGRRMIRRIRLTEYIQDSLPTIDPVKWIPATERDPEKSGAYLVTFRKTEKAPSRWSDEPFIGVDNYIGGWQTGTWFEVTAWAEPPEPWKGVK